MLNDFYQDWNSARNLRNGLPIYADIDLTIERYLGRSPRDWPTGFWRVNAHPPASVLLVYPFAWLGYQNAFFVWTLTSFAALAIALWLIVRHLDIQLSASSVLPCVAMLLLCYPFRSQVNQGQFNLLILLLVTLVWVAARSGCSRCAGVALGVATVVKLFPGLLFLYFVLQREWKVVTFGAATVAAIAVFMAMAFPATTLHTYLVEVLPSLNQWQSHASNISLIGFWSKLFDPIPGGPIAILPVWHSHVLARVGGLLSCGAALAATIVVILQARKRSDLDLAFGLLVTTTLLVSPLTWEHYLVLLILPIAIMWVHLAESGPIKWIWALFVIALFPPQGLIWKHLIPGPWPHVTAEPLHVVTALSYQFYALLGLFTMQWMKAQPSTFRWPISVWHRYVDPRWQMIEDILREQFIKVTSVK